MAVTREAVLDALSRVPAPGGGTLVSRDLVRALGVDGGDIRFVLEAGGPEEAAALEALRPAVEAAVRRLDGVSSVMMRTAAPPAGKPMRIGTHPKPGGPAGPSPVPGIDRILVVGSGKGGVGKSTVASNLAVALARQGRRVGLLDADIYGPSQPRMMGVSGRPESEDGKTMIPLRAHGVVVMSIGFLLEENAAAVWRGPMLMGAIQQMLNQVAWGTLDVLVVDLPPGTGDVQLTLAQRTQLTGAIVVSTPQDVALLDARRALDMFARLKVPVLGLIENMASYICANCGHEAHPFGHGGVATEAARQGLPFLGELPLDLAVRLGGDSGQPVAAGEGPVSAAYAALAARLVADGFA